MDKKPFTVNSDLDRFIYITITEVMLTQAKAKGFGTASSWGIYIRNYMINGADIKRIVYELEGFYEILSNMYALNNSEATTYLISFFRNELWLKYLPFVEESRRYFGTNFYST